jgi:hypothetical protein
MKLTHEFVKTIPREIENGVIYISFEYATAIHKCCCGCGNEVITPFSPSEWKITFDGETITLHPSLGNWNLKCRSHYWIRNSVVEWAPKWNQKQIASAKKRDFVDEQKQLKGKKKKTFFRRVFGKE